MTVPGLVPAPFFDSGDDRAVEIAAQLPLPATALLGLATTAVLLLRHFARGLGRLPRATEPAPSQA